MEPVRGGKLVDKLPSGAKERLKELRPDESLASWCFRWLMTLPNMGVILSGMSTMEQLEDNIRTFSEPRSLTAFEVNELYQIAESLKSNIPCTACRYCTEGCPMELNIPMLIEVYNDLRYAPGVNSASKIEFMPEDKRPTACINCGACVSICPQNIDIPKALSDFAELLTTIPSWKDICAERAEAAAKLASK
jgi:predicted aldo/keto reductase-like oxidoreductase